MPATQRACASTKVSNSIVWNRSAALRRSQPHRQVSGPNAWPTLLWIDDFEPGLALYKKMFEDLGFEVRTASNGEQGVRLAALHSFDVVVTDYEMPRMDGLAVASSIKALKPQTPVLLFSGSTLVPSRRRRVVDACCDKAGSRKELLAAVHRLLHKKRSQALQPSLAAQASHHGHRTVA